MLYGHVQIVYVKICKHEELLFGKHEELLFGKHEELLFGKHEELLFGKGTNRHVDIMSEYWSKL